MQKWTTKMKSTRKTRQEAPRLQKVNSEKNLTINGQPPKSKSTVNDDVSTMTSVRADVVVMTSAKDQRHVERVRSMIQSRRSFGRRVRAREEFDEADSSPVM